MIPGYLQHLVRFIEYMAATVATGSARAEAIVNYPINMLLSLHPTLFGYLSAWAQAWITANQ